MPLQIKPQTIIRDLQQSTPNDEGGNDYTRLLNRHLVPRFNTALGAVSTRAIAHLLDRLQETPSEAAHALAAVRIFFNWCVKRTYISANPCARLSTAKSPARERVLTDDELIAVYRQAETFPYPFGAIVRLLILTGQRRSEVGLLKWDWIKDRTITLSTEITKNKQPHTFPHGKLTAHVLASLPRLNDYVFPAAREHKKGSPVRTINGWSNSKAAFDRLLPIPHWTLHDLRRTFATKHAALGTPIHITERLLNHISGTRSGIVGIYSIIVLISQSKRASVVQCRRWTPAFSIT